MLEIPSAVHRGIPMIMQSFSIHQGSPPKCGCHEQFGFELTEDGLHCKKSEHCGHVRADVVFILDTSLSVDDDDFQDELAIVVHFVRFIQQVYSKRSFNQPACFMKFYFSKDRWTDGWTDRFPLCSTGLCPLRGRCPAPSQLKSHTTQAGHGYR